MLELNRQIVGYLVIPSPLVGEVRERGKRNVHKVDEIRA
jgi:hypothetical protein